MAARGMGVIYQKTSRGEDLRDAPTTAERSAMLNAYYTTHHDRLTAAV